MDTWITFEIQPVAFSCDAFFERLKEHAFRFDEYDEFSYLAEDKTGDSDWVYASIADWRPVVKTFPQRMHAGKRIGISWYRDEGEAGGVITIESDASQITFAWSKNRVAIPGMLRLTEFSWLLTRLDPVFASLAEAISVMKISCHDCLL